LITLDEEEVTNYLKNRGIKGTSGVPLSEHPEVKKLIDREINDKNQQLARFEQIKKYCILKNDFSVETGELTPTMKLKRRVITEKYKKILDDMYEKEDLVSQD